MIPAMRKLIALQAKAMALTARLAFALTIAPEAPAAAMWDRVAVMPGRKQKPEKTRTSFSRQWTGPGSRREAMALEIEAVMELSAVVAEVAGVAALAARQAPGSRRLAAMCRGTKHPDTGMTRVIEIIAAGEVTERAVARAPISQTR